MAGVFKYFKISEFDSPDKPGSGKNMDMQLISMLDQLREKVGFPIKINSGFRTLEHHNNLTKQGYETSKNSAHLLGKAADIGFNGNVVDVIKAAIDVGFKRIGIISSRALHLDIDESKPTPAVWFYSNTPEFLKNKKDLLIEAIKKKMPQLLNQVADC